MALLNVRRHARAMREELEAFEPFLNPEPRPRFEGWETGDDFLPWLEDASPKWDWRWRHLRLIQDRLAAVTRGEIDRLAIFCPPRHGKSQMTTVRYVAYRMERDPGLRVIIGCYNQTLADRFSRDVRRIVRERIPLSTERTSVADWETAAGGGLRAVGVGGGVTGHGADLIVIDDPVKSSEEAQSQPFRERVAEWFIEDLFTRREPGAALVLIQTRWHQDDLAGRILSGSDASKWNVVNLPAFAEEDDPLGRGRIECPECHGSGQSEIEEASCIICEGSGEVGEPLCPERYDATALAEIKRALGRRSFDSLYQQRPRPRDGTLFRFDWFQKVGEVPARARRVRYWDTAGSEGRGDFTVGVLMARSKEGIFYIEDVVRGQWSPARKDDQIRMAADRDAAKYGRGAVQIWLETEAGIGGTERTQATIRRLAGHTVKSERVTGSKETRAEPLAAQAEVGNVKLLAAGWNRVFLDELCDFPFGKNDDQVDAAAGAMAKLSESRRARLFTYEM